MFEECELISFDIIFTLKLYNGKRMKKFSVSSFIYNLESERIILNYENLKYIRYKRKTYYFKHGQTRIKFKIISIKQWPFSLRTPLIPTICFYHFC